MPRYIASEADAHSLAANGHPVEVAADPERSAFALPSAVLVLPGSNDEHAIIATIRTGRARRAEEIAGERRLASYEATGFLGLDDSVVYEDELPKPWWKRLFRS
jgi:hypothetical protein